MPPASNTPVTQKKKQVTKSAKAGLIMPVARFRNNLKKGLYAEHIGIGSAVYMAAVLEYLIAEVSELSGNAASDKKRRRINPRHITMAVRNDSELDKLFRNVIISEGGVLPVIHRELLPKASKKNVKSLGKESEEL